MCGNRTQHLLHRDIPSCFCPFCAIPTFLLFYTYIIIYALYIRTAHCIFPFAEWTRWPPFACYSNTRHGQLQVRRKSHDTKRTLQPHTQARIQASDEGIAPTNLPLCSRISQDPQRSSQQITTLYNAHRNAT